MSFGEKTTKKDFNWEVEEVTAEVQKNKNDVIKIQRARLDDVEYGQIQVWHTNMDGVSMPKRDSNVTFRLELKEEILKGIEKL